MSESNGEKIWENPDPRIKWALDILDFEGTEPTTMLDYYFWPAVLGAGGVVAGFGHNLYFRRPMISALPYSLTMACLSWFAGGFGRDYMAKKHAERRAVMEHYIMLHPERFPEPVRIPPLQAGITLNDITSEFCRKK